jgi:diguanylate cyclase (GGDEF)-like protein
MSKYYKVPQLPAELKKPTTEREKAYLDYIKGLVRQVQQDFMTGFLHKEEYSRRKSDFGAGVYIFIDGDGLKKINDSLGHAAGTAAILGISNGIKQALRGSDEVIISRPGGDEFVIFVEGASVSTGVQIGKRILAKIQEQSIASFYEEDDEEVKQKLQDWPLNASVGVGKTEQEADKAMYKAKQKGRGRVEFFTSSKDPEEPNGQPKAAKLKALIRQANKAGNKKLSSKLNKLLKE